MQTAIYVRVSTTMQDFDNQIKQLRDYCKKSDWTIYKEFCDIISGKEESRPEYDNLFKEAHQKKFDIVLFWALDRFSRSGTLFTLQKLKELENLGIDWHSYSEPYISSIGPWKDVVISIFATIAKLEAKRISDRTKAGLEKIKDELKEKKFYVTKAGKKIENLGRPKIPDETVQEVVNYLKKGELSYKKISELVTYKVKFGKVRNISPAQITKIKKRCLQNG